MLWLSLVLLWLPLPAAGQETRAAHGADEEVEAILELFGVRAQIDQMPEIILAALAQHQTRMEPEIYGALRTAFEQSFTAEALYDEVAATFTRQAEQKRFVAALAWLNTPLSKKMTALEVAAGTAEAVQEIQKFGANMDQRSPSKPRWAIIERMDEVLGATDAGLELQIAILRALLEGVNPMLPQDRRTTPEQLDALAASVRTQLRAALQQQIRVALLYTYRDVPQPELTEYLAHWETDDGQWLIRTANQVMLEAVTAAGKKAGTLLALQGIDVAPRE